VVLGCVLLCYAPAAPQSDKAALARVEQEANTAATAGPTISPDASAAEVYRQTARIAEEHLRHWLPRPAEVWQRPWNRDQALQEFHGFQERLGGLEDAAGRLPAVSEAAESRMFALWQRLQVQGTPTAAETDAGVPARGGPNNAVVLASGELVLSQTDASLPGRAGVGFALVRYYRSQVDYHGPLGPGWDHSCNQRIVAEGHATPPASLVWYTGERAVRFTRHGQAWEPEPGAFYRLQMQGEKVIVETAERMRLEFEPARQRRPGLQRWRIARMAGRHDQWQANVVKFHYWPESDVLAAVQDPFGNKVRFVHDAQGRLSAIECGNRGVLYQYDDTGRLVGVSVPRVAVRLAQAEDVTWHYAYVRDLNGRSWLKQVIPPGGLSETVYDYQLTADQPAYGRVVKATLRGRDPNAAPEDAVWTFGVEQAGDACIVTHQPPAPLPQEEWTFPIENGQVRCYPLGRMIRSQQAEWRWKYNPAGQVLEERSPLGGVSRWRYDADQADPRFRGNLLEKEELARPGPNPLPLAKRGWRWEYHAEIALPVRAVAYEVSHEGHERILLESRFEYDARDLDLVLERTGEKTTRTVRNRYGLPVVEWDGRGCATVYRYYSSYTAGTPSVRSGGLQAECVVDASAAAVAAALRDVNAEPASAPARQAEGQPCQRVSKFQYNQHGCLSTEEHPNHQVRRLWSKLGQVLAVLDTRSDLTVYDYDAALRRTGQWRRIQRLQDAPYPGETRPDAPGQFAAERLQYDAFGRLAVWHSTLEPWGWEKPRPPEVRYEYYPSGQLKKRITPAGTAVEIRYDEATGRQKELRLVSHAASQETLVLRSEMTYDAEGFLISYRDGRAKSYKAEPDAFGRAMATVRPDGLRTETLSDGLDRPVCERVVTAQGQLVQERKYHYDVSGRLVKVDHNRLPTQPSVTTGEEQQSSMDQWLVAEETRYDPEGNVVARRAWQPEAWETFGYDGLGRLVWRQSPDGDRHEAFYQGDWLCVETQVLRHTARAEKPEVRTLHTVTLRDDRGKPWCTVPVGHGGAVGIRRARLTHYDSAGNVALEVQPESTKTVRLYTTLGLLVRETVQTADAEGKLLAQTTNWHDPDGLLVRREIFNRPLVFLPSHELPHALVPERQVVPQIRELKYDGFRRLWQETAPDGMVQEYTYGPDSRVIALVRHHLSKPEHKERVAFAYDDVGRLTQVQNGTAQQDPAPLVQQFAYDWQDQIIEAWDYGQPAHPVRVNRCYDNLGHLLKEEIRLPNDGLQGVALEYHYDLPQGKHSARLVGGDGQPAGWRTLEVQQDPTGRVRKIAKDGRNFCRLEYLGGQEVQKSLVETAVTETARLDPFLEPEAQRLVEMQAPDRPIYEMHYLRDDLGRVIASSIRAETKGWECSKFFDRDSVGNLIADDTQAKFLDPKELAAKRNELLKRPERPDDAVPIGIYHVRRHEYDEAGNMIASYRGPATGLWPPGTELASSWNPARQTQVADRRAPRMHLTAFAPTAIPEAQNPKPPDARGAAEKARQWDLASNRTACKAMVYQAQPCRASLRAMYQYDDFGRLVRYHSHATGRLLRWELEYDVLGRMVGMKGFDASQSHDRQQQATPKQAENPPPCYQLRFAYDPFNRRIVKHVQPSQQADQGANGTVQVMLYTGQRPAVKLRKPADPAKPWPIEGQYIWGAGPSKVLAYYSGGGNEHEYLLHQDAALNVVLSTRRSQGKLEICDVASYWGLGKNSTTGVVQQVVSSLAGEKGRQAKWAIDRVLDDKSAAWIGTDDRGFLTLKLAQRQRLNAAEIWADNLPDQFRPYVVGEGQGPRPKDALPQWEKQHEQDRVSGEVRDPAVADNPTPASPHEPRKLLLDGREGQEIVLVWDTCPGGIAVREFEVFVQPLHPGDLAFSGTIYDAETGLYYHGARYRLPELGTFISPDPLGFLGGDNLYAFAHNDPLTWHDPDGRFAHIVVGAGVGGLLGAASYVFQWWWYDEEWSWARLGIYAGASATSGAVAALVGPAALAFTASHGVPATVSALTAATLAGGTGGAVHAAIQVGGTTYLDTGSGRASLWAAATAALYQGALGAIGGVAGGAVLSKLGGSGWGFVAAGAAGGGTVGVVSGGVAGYRTTGTLYGTLSGMAYGGISGTIVGATIGGAAWWVGRVTGPIRELPNQPEDLPDPRSKGILIRTNGKRGDYGGVEAEPGQARHHIKPLSLGGTDTPDNIVKVPIDVHRQLHPTPAVIKEPVGTIFY